jgi:hypothetical protein
MRTFFVYLGLGAMVAAAYFIPLSLAAISILVASTAYWSLCQKQVEVYQYNLDAMAVNNANMIAMEQQLTRRRES